MRQAKNGGETMKASSKLDLCLNTSRKIGNKFSNDFRGYFLGALVAEMQFAESKDIDSINLKKIEELANSAMDFAQEEEMANFKKLLFKREA